MVAVVVVLVVLVIVVVIVVVVVLGIVLKYLTFFHHFTLSPITLEAPLLTI